ncbi:EpsG family protein [Sphingopyxis sp. 113P3]|uniref:EpsG family protein n=1 Tax=Sphingopyxis sp. (strain 113P3) TaxID=292913 RepID=UPI0006AD4F00|nr:EpsG family protein [Sphingopyxis sp. 113P3]ALC12107.1 hypothetical protein LH20_09115 [Sphingopyxis sp. 113P3]
MNFAHRRLGFFAVAILFIVVSIFVGNRDLSVGTDTMAYSYNFSSMYSRFVLKEYDVGFYYLSELIHFFTDDYRIYFSILFLIFNISIFLFSKKVIPSVDVATLFMLSGFLFISSWYENATLNTIRHGLSLPFSYLSLILFHEKNFLKSAICGAVATALHFSALMIFPFFVLMMIPFRFVFILFVLMSVAYVTGISNFIFKFISGVLSLSYYDDIQEYAPEVGGFFGFYVGFFLYSTFWGIFYFCLQRFIRREYIEDFRVSLKIYYVLIMPFFAFAHGSLPSRFAFIAWLYLPILHCSFVRCSKLKDYDIYYISFIVFTIGVFNYLAVILNFAR